MTQKEFFEKRENRKPEKERQENRIERFKNIFLEKLKRKAEQEKEKNTIE